MKKFSFIVFIIFLLFSSFTLSAVITTINPYYLLVKQLLGSGEIVSLLLPPDLNPHVFSLKPSDAKKLEEAKLIVANGLGLEPYLENYREKTVFVADLVPRHTLVDENPHVWLSPILLKDYIVPSLSKVLMDKFPHLSGEIEKNAKKLIEELNDFTVKARETLSTYKGVKVIVVHPSFLYFFKDFGLEMVSLMEEGHEAQVSFSRIREILGSSRDIRAIFREPQMPQQVVEPLERELKKKSYVLDPLGIDGEKSLLELLEKNLKVVLEALR